MQRIYKNGQLVKVIKDGKVIIGQMQTVKRTFRISVDADEKLKRMKDKKGRTKDALVNEAIMKSR